MESDREEHIARHGVSIEEVEDVVFGTPLILQAREGRYHLIGQTTSGRYLAVYLSSRERGVYGLVTAREADDWERRLHRKNRRR